MTLLDYLVLAGFMIWLLVIGAIFSRRMKNSADMFSAGGQSPWWISGLSGFMTIFSAGTFVVWGGIAYEQGLVAVSLLTVTGMSAVLVGHLLASRWRQMGIATPTEYLRIRFSEGVVQVYTWLGFVLRGIGLSVALYSLAIMLAVLVPLPEGSMLRDPATGNLSVNLCIVIWGLVVIAYTMSGGLWAVMMTDVIQCIVLSLLVLVAVPLSLNAVGGLDGLWQGVPDGFFIPATSEFSYFYLVLWFCLGFFRYGADWAFVQRYICVPTPADARKSAFLMGGLYAISPIFWMLPAIAYQVIDPNAKPSDAYVLMCQHIFPAGMLGIMVAAMFSATASMVSSLLNVFAGVFVVDVYKPFINPNASEKHLLNAGRLATLIYGLIVIGGAVMVPSFGGAKNVVLILVTVLLGPLFVPVVWGVFSKHITQRAVWVTLGVSGGLAAAIRVGPMIEILLSEHVGGKGIPLPETISFATRWITEHTRMIDAVLGLVPPILVLTVLEIRARRGPVAAGWKRMEDAVTHFEEQPAIQAASRLPTLLVAASLAMLSATMIVIAVLANEQQRVLALFAALLLLASTGMFWSIRKPRTG